VTLVRSFNLNIAVEVVATLMCLLLFVGLCLGAAGRKVDIKMEEIFKWCKQDPLSGQYFLPTLRNAVPEHRCRRVITICRVCSL
jgi:hypothetical protein